MRLWAGAVAIALTLVGATVARAQDAAGGATAGGGGVQVSDAMVLHSGVGAELAYTSNVFFEDSDDTPRDSAIGRIKGFLGVSNAPRVTAGASDTRRYDLDLGVNAVYSEYLTSDDNIQAQRDVGVSATAKFVINPRGKGYLGLEDSLVRSVQPTNFESSDNMNRLINRAHLFAGWRPGEGAIDLRAGYAFTFDIFENDDFEAADRLIHELKLSATWQYLPITRFTFDYTQQFVDVRTANRSDGAPMKITVGAATLFSVKTLASVRVGYGNGFYDDRAAMALVPGANYSNVIAGVDLSWLPTPLSRLTLSYDHNFADSVFSNFYVDDAVRLRLDQNLRGKINLRAKAEYRHRTYEGLPDYSAQMITFNDTQRSDHIFQGELMADYVLSDRYALNGGYTVTVDATDFRVLQQGIEEDPSYVRHDVFAGFSASF